MPFDPTHLNAVLYQNENVLPRSSPGYPEVSLAVAELHGSNHAKALALAEAALGKDPHLAAAWLTKAVADALAATATDLHTERAVFCLDRAVECAPGSHALLAEFFVATILGHYVEVLCQSAVTHADKMVTAETAATKAQLQAMLLEVGGCVSAATAFCSRRLSTQVAAGLASAAAFGVASARNQEAQILALVAGDARLGSLLELLPARQIIFASANIVWAVNASTDSLLPSIRRFTSAYRHVLNAHLQRVAAVVLPVVEQYRNWRSQGAFDSTAEYRQGFLRFVEATMPGVEATQPYRFLQSPADYLAPRLPTAKEKFSTETGWALPSAARFPGGKEARKQAIKDRVQALEAQTDHVLRYVRYVFTPEAWLDAEGRRRVSAHLVRPEPQAA